MFDMEPFGDKRVPGTGIGLANVLREYSPEVVIPAFWPYINNILAYNRTSRTSIGGYKDIWTGLEDRNDI